METRCVLPSMRNIAVPADCTRPQLGAGRNRYVSAAPAWNRTPGLAVQNNKSRLSVAANKSCLQGWPFKIWSCCPAPYGNGTHVCAALTGGRIIAAPFFAKNPISLYSRSDGRETLNRRSAHHKHKIAKGSNPTGGGTAVTNPTSRTGGTELRLFHFGTFPSPHQPIEIRTVPKNRPGAWGNAAGFRVQRRIRFFIMVRPRSDLHPVLKTNKHGAGLSFP